MAGMLGAIFKGFRSVLSADATVTGFVDDKIYTILAPTTDDGSVAIELPWLVIQLAAGGDVNVSPKDMMDVEVDVMAIADSALEAQNIADACRSALHLSSPTLEDGWETYDLQHQNAVMYQQTVERRQYWHAGGSYRLRAVQEA